MWLSFTSLISEEIHEALMFLSTKRGCRRWCSGYGCWLVFFDFGGVGRLMCHGLLVLVRSIFPWRTGIRREAMQKEAVINEMAKSTTMGAFSVLVLSIFGRPIGNTIGRPVGRAGVFWKYVCLDSLPISKWDCFCCSCFCQY